MFFLPNLRFLPVGFDTGNQGTSSIVAMLSSRPGRQSGIEEWWVFEPGIFEMKDAGARDISVEGEKERDMIGSRANTRSESAVRELAVEVCVQESAI